MQFKTIITYIDIDTGEFLDLTRDELVRKYDFTKRKDKTIIKDDLCTLVYIYECKEKQQLEIPFNNNKKKFIK